VAKLTDKQETFCQQYVLNGRDASAAYRAAYNAEKMKPESVNVNASKLLKNAKVAPRVEELLKKVSEVAERDFNITAQTVLLEAKEMLDVALGRLPTKVVHKDSIGDGMTRHEEIEVYAHNLTAAGKAIELLGKHVDVKAFKSDDINLNVSVDIKDRLTRAISRVKRDDGD